MPKKPAGKKAAKSQSSTVVSADPGQPAPGTGTNYDPDSLPPVSTNPPIEPPVPQAPAEPETPGGQHIWDQAPPAPEAVDWNGGRTEVWRLDNGSILIARNETASDVYKSKGATLVDFYYDKESSE